MNLSRESLEAALDHLRAAPSDHGALRYVVARPHPGERVVLAEGRLDVEMGLVGDSWKARGSRHTPDGDAEQSKQVTVMNVRVAELVAGGAQRLPLCGDQLYVDLDLSVENVPAGSFLAVGDAVLQVSPEPHLGCKKFVARFGSEAMRFVNSRLGRQLRLRGVNTSVVVAGTVRPGDVMRKVTAPAVPLMRRPAPAQVRGPVPAPAASAPTPLSPRG
ncbi:MAG TPA: hypothetical protein VFT62_08195 [Mycobacteriales bacterium]|nr:hypothetical protein [Mycobacteriales bacterium]